RPASSAPTPSGSPPASPSSSSSSSRSDERRLDGAQPGAEVPALPVPEREMSAHGWITTTLILLPLIAGMVIWVVPMPRVWIGPAALAVALAEILFWIEAVARFDFDKGGLQEANQ